MRQLFIILFCFTIISLSAQTKEIAFESHSGNPDNLSIAMANDLFDTDESDYGLPADKQVYKIDNLIFVSDSVTVIISKKFSRPWSATSDSLDKYVAAVKDTVHNDPLFRNRHSLDSIKLILKARERYELTDKTKFTRFDNKKDIDKKPEDKPQQLLHLYKVMNKK